MEGHVQQGWQAQQACGRAVPHACLPCVIVQGAWLQCVAAEPRVRGVRGVRSCVNGVRSCVRGACLLCR